MTGDTRKRTFGLAAILVVGTIAGFLAAAGTGGAQYATVGTIAESQAYQMPVEEEDQRVRFALEADQATATEPAASFALYDPADGFFAEFDLAGEGDDAEAILDDRGAWVLFVTERRNAELAIQYETEDDTGEAIELEQLEVREERTLVAEQEGGSLDEEVVFRLDHRPASAFLTFEGDVANLDATVASDEGSVYELSDASVNASEEGSRTGEVDVTSAHLATGTYHVEATADAFDGELAFVHQTYDRVDAEPPVEEEPEEPNVTYPEAHEGAIVAELDEGQAYEVTTAEAGELVFLAEPDTEAELMVYNESDRLVDRVEIDRGHHEWHSSSEEEANESEEEDQDDQPDSEPPAAVLAVPEQGSYVVYAKDVYPNDATVQTFVADEDAQADALEVETQQATIEGNEGEWNTTLDGALVEISAWSQDVATMDRNLTATGEAGPVLHYEQAWNSFGATVSQEHSVYPDRFTSGDLDVTVDADGFGGQTSIELVHYVR